MKDSAWYHKLWKKKFDRLPLHDSTEASWLGMSTLLDEKMPTVNVKPSVNPSKFKLAAKVVKLLKVILPLAVTGSAIIYYHQANPERKQVQSTSKIKPIQQDSIIKNNVEVQEDSGITNRDIAGVLPEKRPVHSNDIKLNVSLAEKSEFVHQSVGYASATDAVRSATSESQILLLPGLYNPNNLQIERSKVQMLLFGFESQDETLDGKTTPLIATLLKPGTLVTSLASESKTTGNAGAGSSLSNNQHRISGEVPDNKEVPGKTKKIKAKNNKGTKSQNESTAGHYSYGITGGLNVAKTQNFYVGIFGNYALKEKLVLGIGLNINTKRNISGEFTHPSYFRPDTPFTISDTRKITVMDIPLTVGYRLSKLISVKAGPILSLSLKQSEAVTKLMPIADPRDTIYHSKEINAALAGTVMGKINFGFTGGINLQYKRFDINANYQWLTPYRISNSLGSTKETYEFFRLGLGYRFK